MKKFCCGGGRPLDNTLSSAALRYLTKGINSGFSLEKHFAMASSPIATPARRIRMFCWGMIIMLFACYIGLFITLPDPMIENLMKVPAIYWGWVSYTLLSWGYGFFLVGCALKGTTPWRVSNFTAFPARWSKAKNN